MAIAFATPVGQSGGQPSAPVFVTKVTVTGLAADTYATGGIAVPASLGSSWQAAVGTDRTILGTHAQGRVTSSGESDGLEWRVNRTTNRLQAWESGGAGAAQSEKTNAETFGANFTVDVLIWSV